LRGLALAHSELGECSAALSVLQDALNVALASGEDYLHIPVLRSIGAIYNGQGRWKEAFEIFESLLITESALKDRSLRLELLTESGYSLRRLGRRNEAIQVFIEAIDLATTLGDRHSEGTAIYGLSMVYADQGHLAAALGGLSQDLAIAREFRDRSGEATSLNAIGTLYHRQKRWDESEACLLDSLELRERLGQIAMQGMTRSNLAVLYKDQGMYQKALESAEAAVRLLSETEDARRLRRAKDLIFEIKTELASHSDQSLDAQE
jgi:tetratricopeptide (TPR) repeat protein